MAEKTITTKKCTLSLEGAHKFTGTLIYKEKGTYESVKAGIPARGTRSSHFASEAVLQKADMEPLGGETWQVTLTYYERAAWTGEEISIEKTPANYTLNSVAKERSVLKHPSYKTAFAKYPNVRGLFERALKNGAADMVFPSKKGAGDYDPDTSAQKVTIAYVVSKFTGEGEDFNAIMKCWKHISSGEKTCTAVHYVLTVATTENTIKIEKGLGKIEDPKGAPKLPWEGGNWRLISVNTQGTTADGFTVTKTYESSAEGESWDKELYS
ncbi:hypothetical protein [Candidatus Spyradosoma sp. SGI.093]|uniref:hypothetical protein n=1 Tax=Candidatus Spyradosoma sp. SGI.093 TaxID=3420583 RepID=UPI003CFC7637